MESIPRKLIVCLNVLSEAFEYATDVNADRWDFAVPIEDLKATGCGETDFRWFVKKKYVEHAREVTALGDRGRHFYPTGDLSFCSETCFVLTDAGFCAAAGMNTQGSYADSKRQVDVPSTTTTPKWLSEQRILRLDDAVIKRFKWRAENQETILTAFEEEGWPLRIDDPLPPQPEQDSRRRLSDTIKGLNKKQTNNLIRFHGDGTGEGITWELIGNGFG